MTWVDEDRKKSWLQNIICNTLKQGPIPKHVAFIMDGNRRYARKNMLDKSKGHQLGFEKLAETLDWCNDLDIEEVTVYAFSIENFKRSETEVDGLMELAYEKFLKLFEEKDKLKKYGIGIRIIGDITLLPLKLQKIIAAAMLLTRNNTKRILNVCFSYTSRDEICAGMREIAEGIQLDLIQECDVTEELLSDCFYLNKSADPDMLIRTSGEVRLSDFLLWQSGFSVLSFMKVLWPDLTYWHLYAGILHYQQNVKAVQQSKYESIKATPFIDADQEKRVQSFKLHVKQKRENLIQNLSSQFHLHS